MLEIGTANGYSALQFSQVLEQDTTITTIEYAWNAHIEAVEHFKNCKVKNIYAIWGDAKVVIPTLQNGYFDFLYIDAMKREYLDYLLLSLTKLTSDAVIVIDDVEKFRDKMQNLYLYLDENGINYTLEKTDADDSIMILFKKDILCESSPI
jgi:predicted O-methyltransferase YrrM